MLAVQTENVAEVSCLILPLRRVQLVVPALCVAEVLPWRALVPLPAGPRWCAGTLNWHGAIIPAVDHEAFEAAEGAEGFLAGRCLAVINRTTPDAAWPFYALVLHGIPRLVQVAQVDLSAEQGPEIPGELLRVKVGTELLVIPDLAALARQVARLIPGSA